MRFVSAQPSQINGSVASFAARLVRRMERNLYQYAMRNLVVDSSNGQFACLLGRPLVSSLLSEQLQLLWFASSVVQSAESLNPQGMCAFESLIRTREANGREERKAT